MLKLTLHTNTLLLIVCFILTGTHACGNAVHNYVCQQAFSSLAQTELKSLLANHVNSFQNGASFPDWAYSLGDPSLHSASEAAHWPPFIVTLVEHIIQKLPGPNVEPSPEVKSLISLLYGIMCHSAADIVWHDLAGVGQTSQGWIQSMADVNFQGSYDLAHSESDNGGEFSLVNDHDLSFLQDYWYFPTQDILEVYQELNFTLVNVQNLVEGNLVLFAEVSAFHFSNDDEVFELLSIFAQQSPFLMEELDTFWLGGLNDMSVWTQRCWRDLTRWLGQKKVDTSLCTIEPAVSDEQVLDRGKGFRESLYWKLYGDAFISNVDVKSQGRGVSFSYKESPQVVFERRTAQLKNNNPSLLPLHLSGHSQTDASSPNCANSTGYPLYSKSRTFSIEMKNALFGSSTTLSRSGDLVVGAPGYSHPGSPARGAVIVLSGTNSWGTTNFIDPSKPSSGVKIIEGNEEGALFGSQVVLVDLDRDGIDDIVASAPSANSSSVDYRGEIYIFYGNASLRTQDPVISSPDAVIYVPQGDQGEGAYTNLGTRLLSGDIDGDGYNDLVIGSHYACFPLTQLCGSGDNLQTGFVAIFLSSKWSSNSPQIPISQSQWLYWGEGPFSWFGYHISFSSEEQILFVGSPTTNSVYSPQQFSVGTLYAFKVSRGPNFSLKLLWTIKGTKQFSKIGSYVSVTHGNPYGPKNAPRFGWRGSVVEGEPGEHKLRDGSMCFLAISAPTDDIDSGAQLYWQGGSVLVINLLSIKAGHHSFDSLIPFGVLFQGEESFARFGWRTGWSDSDSDGVPALWISSPFMNRGRGGLYRWNGGPSFPSVGTVVKLPHTNPPPTPNSPPSPVAPTAWNCLINDATIVGGHFGFTMSFVPGVVDVVVSSPDDSSFSWTNAGSITVLFAPSDK